MRCEKCGWLLRLSYLFCWRHASCQTDIIVFSCEYWLPTANGSCGAPRAGPHFGCVERDGPTFIFIYLIKSRLVVTIKRGSNYPLLCIARNTWTNLPHDDWHQSDNWIHRIPYIQSDKPCSWFTDLYIKKTWQLENAGDVKQAVEVHGPWPSGRIKSYREILNLSVYKRSLVDLGRHLKSKLHELCGSIQDCLIIDFFFRNTLN